MVSIGNKSKLSTKEICQSCANCCKTFSWSDNLDMAIRFMWMYDKDVIAEDTPFKFNDGSDIKTITLKKNCCMLEKKGKTYSCSAWNKERPDFCNTYPDHIFSGVKKTDRKKIQQLINFEKKTCPIFKKMTVDKIIKIMGTKNSVYLYK